MKTMTTALVLLLILLLLGIGFIYSGLYPVGADNRHHPATYWLLDTLRNQSITRASKHIEVPPLDDAQLLLSGGADYNDMCAGCHLKPGVSESDMTIGLYPKPPNLTVQPKSDDAQAIARRQFWVIKHGIMASGMAAFGPTHSDERLWAMVAFLRRLPELTPDQYQIITTRQ